jgi:hypothetical protein
VSQFVSKFVDLTFSDFSVVFSFSFLLLIRGEKIKVGNAGKGNVAHLLWFSTFRTDVHTVPAVATVVVSTFYAFLAFWASDPTNTVGPSVRVRIPSPSVA